MQRSRGPVRAVLSIAHHTRWLAPLPIVAWMLSGQPARSLDRVDAFIEALDTRVPASLLRYGVPSAVISVVHNGRTTTRAWGLADIVSGRAASGSTSYNIASISKVITAWGVMHLVEEGQVDLDAPISRYTKRFTLPEAPANAAVTVRRVLSHTSGLSMPAVPWYSPTEAVPSLPDMLADSKDPLRLIDKPGAAYHYSGGGFALLQMLIEDVTGERYEPYITRTILRPLGMVHSQFLPSALNGDVATPYAESLRPEPHYRFAANAAAGLYTTAGDLAHFAIASTTAAAGAGVLRGTTVKAMQEQQRPAQDDPFGYGLGYSLVPLPATSGHIVGHAGSNEGWTAIWDVLPSSGDAIVVLMNRSGGFPVYRGLLCDWVDATGAGRWRGFCDEPRTSWTAADTAFVDDVFRGTSPTDPAVAVLVADGSGVVYRKAFGGRDARAATAATADTPFYIASLAKSLTAIVSLQFIADGSWTLDDPIGKFLPELPEFARTVTIDQLLSHTSGLPNYQDLIDWSRYDGMTNAKVIPLLAKRGGLDFPAGSCYAYTNTGYVLLASAIERIAKRPYRDVLRERVLEPLGMRATMVDDGYAPAPDGRAVGYAREAGRLVISDYHMVTVDSREFPLRSSTFGAGGMYSTVDDLYTFERALRTARLLPLSLQMMAMTPRTAVANELEVPAITGHGYGWFTSRRGGRNVIWNTGDLAGHHTAILRVPDQQFAVIVLSSSSERSASAIGLSIVDHVFPPTAKP